MWGQRNRFAGQTPRGWLRDLGAQHFSSKAMTNVARIFFAKNILGGGTCFLNRSRRKSSLLGFQAYIRARVAIFSPPASLRPPPQPAAFLIEGNMAGEGRRSLTRRRKTSASYTLAARTRQSSRDRYSPLHVLRVDRSNVHKTRSVRLASGTGFVPKRAIQRRPSAAFSTQVVFIAVVFLCTHIKVRTGLHEGGSPGINSGLDAISARWTALPLILSSSPATICSVALGWLKQGHVRDWQPSHKRCWTNHLCAFDDATISFSPEITSACDFLLYTGPKT